MHHGPAQRHLGPARGTGVLRAPRAHPVLGSRLVLCPGILVNLPETDAVTVLGPVDAQQLWSPMTLFARTAREPLCQEAPGQ